MDQTGRASRAVVDKKMNTEYLFGHQQESAKDGTRYRALVAPVCVLLILGLGVGTEATRALDPAYVNLTFHGLTHPNKGASKRFIYSAIVSVRAVP